MSLRLSADEAWAFLENGHTGILTSLRRDGWPISLPVWYVALERRIYVSGPARTKKFGRMKRDPRVALMFLIPGSNTTMRINGRAVVSVDPDLLESFEMDGKHPRTVIVVTIDEVYFQCARALMRSELWNPDNFVDPASLPTPGLLLKAAKAEFDQETYDREWAARAAKTMW